MSYTGANIKILKGLEAVKLRPGMYIGNTENGAGYYKMFAEVLENSVDEMRDGHATEVKVVQHNINTITVIDNGRGIPIDFNTDEGKSNLEIVLTVLHAGGKFNDSSYKFSGGLHGVGVSVVCALSETLYARVIRDGKHMFMKFKNGVKVYERLVSNPYPHITSMTVITFTPSNSIFKNIISFDGAQIIRHLKTLSYLVPNRLFHYFANGVSHTYHSEQGISEYLEDVSHDPLTSTFKISGKAENFEIDIAFKWCNTPKKMIFAFTNNIPQVDGSHVTGFIQGVYFLLNKLFIQHYPKLKLTKEEVVEGLAAVINLKMSNPSYSSQTKEYLVSEQAKTFIYNHVKLTLEELLLVHANEIKLVLTRIFELVKIRDHILKQKEVDRKKYSEKVILPGKLGDCISRDISNNELFIVEGESAGGSAKLGRDKHTQAILPLKGKVINAAKHHIQKIINSEEVICLVNTMGLRFNHSTDNPRYGKLIIMTDADHDGLHIRCLLLVLLYRYFPDLIEAGRVYVAQPPLFGYIGKKKPIYFNSVIEFVNFSGALNPYSEKLKRFLSHILILSHARALSILLSFCGVYKREYINNYCNIYTRPFYMESIPSDLMYVLEDSARDTELEDSAKHEEIIAAFEKLYTQFNSGAIQRYKGLGEMNPDQLYETTMDPSVRSLKQIFIDSKTGSDEKMSILLGEDIVSRKALVLNMHFLNSETI